MRYFITDAHFPISYITCGNLISRENFCHNRRTLEEHVLILVNEGTLYIAQSGVKYEVGAKQYIFLKAGEEHYGYQPSKGTLSYYWVHFTTKEPVLVQSDITPDFLERNAFADEIYLMPEWGRLSLTKRVFVLFNQLLDLSRQEQLYSSRMTDYALSLLILEISQEFMDMKDHKSQNIPPNISRIMEWIKANYFKSVTIAQIAKDTGYNPDYLSSLFKRTTGITLTRYINKIRIEAAKSLLASYHISIKEAAYSCGFLDEKYFMKVFKQIEGMTPSQYKKAFTKKKIN
ncbi:AraC family transcriptional regulator [Konateibacter massiliensis]|uniref:AraC family transcriptional regulator n=1 Tax=Konateibacter massiliensis TaxID=2002841 RepID=UPI000C15816E|nr:AraC family transcriptional regulator [Konateibacter massiliensis]